MYSAIQAAVAAEHVRDMLGRAAQDGRARQARHARRARRARAAGRARLARQAQLVGAAGPVGGPGAPIGVSTGHLAGAHADAPGHSD